LRLIGVTCDQQRSAVGHVIHIVLWLSNGWYVYALSVGSLPFVRPSVLHGNSR